MWHAVVVIETRCELVSDCKPHVGMPTCSTWVATWPAPQTATPIPYGPNTMARSAVSR